MNNAKLTIDVDGKEEHQRYFLRIEAKNTVLSIQITQHQLILLTLNGEIPISEIPTEEVKE